MLRSQPHYMQGPRHRFAIKFFTLAVYVTMYLRDSESTVYRRLGIDWQKFDAKVINETERAAREVWGLGIRTDSRFFSRCLQTMACNNGRNKIGRTQTGLRRLPAFAMRYVRYADNVLQYAKLMLQPHDAVPAVARADWTRACPMPGDTPTIELANGVAPLTLRKRTPPAQVPADDATVAAV